VGKETYWALDDGHKDRILKLHGNGRSNPEIVAGDFRDTNVTQRCPAAPAVPSRRRLPRRAGRAL
jgi:hypothetical protein